MLQTMGGNPKDFNRLDLKRLPSPCFVIDKIALQSNLEILYKLKKETNVKILIALKAFSTFSLAGLISKYLDGSCCSGLYEAKLAKKYFKGEISTYSPARNTLIPLIKNMKWLNLGGGHHITRKDYQLNELKYFLKKVSNETNCQIYIEPGEAVVLDSGILVGEVIDCFKPSNELSPNIAVTDISATSHIPDVIEAPYRPALLNEPDIGHKVILGGPSCLAGDVIGEYNFNDIPKMGDRIALLDQAHYTMVKTSFFNGVKLPSIAIWDSETDNLEIIKSFSFKDFENKL